MSTLPIAPERARHLAGDTYVFEGLTNSGFIDGLVIDTGPDEGVYEGVTCDRLVITHGHADHFACGAYLRDRGAEVLVARDDATLVENPEVNIRGMFSWARPGDMLVTKLFLGTPCVVDGYFDTWNDERATPLALPGHTMGHTGFLTRDHVLFTGDILYLREIWKQHRLPYSIGPDLTAESLERVRATDFEWLVPGHGRPIHRDEADDHIDHHLQQLSEIENVLLEGLRTERTTEDAIALVSAARDLGDNPAQYWLAVTTVKGFLGDLLGRGEIEFFVRDHAGWWRTAR